MGIDDWLTYWARHVGLLDDYDDGSEVVNLLVNRDFIERLAGSLGVDQLAVLRDADQRFLAARPELVRRFSGAFLPYVKSIPPDGWWWDPARMPDWATTASVTA